jgi:uncharacterized membrane protein YqgA involved in biofilm formation
VSLIGTGTAVNVLAVLVGSSIGATVGHVVPRRVQEGVTLAIGLTVGVIAALALSDLSSQQLTALVGPVLGSDGGMGDALLVVVLGVLLGAGLGAWWRLEERLESVGESIRRRTRTIWGGSRGGTGPRDREQFVEGFVAASLVFCAGPLTVVGSLNEGLGRGADELLLKSMLDLVASTALATVFGWGVAASVVVIIVVQGSLTVVGLLLQGVLGEGYVAAMSVAGGFVLLALSIRLLGLRDVRVADLLPALATTPALIWVLP